MNFNPQLRALIAYFTLICLVNFNPQLRALFAYFTLICLVNFNPIKRKDSFPNPDTDGHLCIICGKQFISSDLVQVWIYVKGTVRVVFKWPSKLHAKMAMADWLLIINNWEILGNKHFLRKKKDVLLIRLRFQGCRCKSGRLALHGGSLKTTRTVPLLSNFLEGSKGHVLVNRSREFFNWIYGQDYDC